MIRGKSGKDEQTQSRYNLDAIKMPSKCNLDAILNANQMQFKCNLNAKFIPLREGEEVGIKAISAKLSFG